MSQNQPRRGADALSGLRQAIVDLDPAAFARCFSPGGWLRVPRPEGDLVLNGPDEIAQAGHELRPHLLDLTWTPSQRFVAAGQVVEEAVARARTETDDDVRAPMRVVAALDPAGRIGSLTLWVDWAALNDPHGVQSAHGAASALVAQARARDARGLRVIESDPGTAAPAPVPMPAPVPRVNGSTRPPALVIWWKQHRATFAGSVMAVAAIAVIGWVGSDAVRPIVDKRWGTPTASVTSAPAVLGADEQTAKPTPEPAASELPLIVPEQPRSEPTEQPGRAYDLKARFLFETGSTDLTAAARAELREVAATVRAEKVTGNIQVNGYTDEIGRPEDNLRLSRRRAQAVAVALRAELGGVAVKLAPQGFGERRPADSNRTEAGRANNRRVVIILPEPR